MMRKFLFRAFRRNSDGSIPKTKAGWLPRIDCDHAGERAAARPGTVLHHLLGIS